MEITEIIKNHSAIVRKHIISRFSDIENLLIPTKFEEVITMRRVLADFTASGKLIRGSLYLLVSKMYGNEKIDDLLDIAIALEINQSGLLIHDDVMDNDLLRRGKPSIHVRYSLLSDQLGISDKERFGKSMAICIGDICFFTSQFFIEKSLLPPAIKSAVVGYYNLQLIKTGLSQMSDVKYGLSCKDPDFSEILRIYQYKTANYSFNSPFVMGYLSSGQKDTIEIALLEKVGYSLGIIYQITDDLLGFTQNKEIIGKDAGSDIRENKKTIIRYFMLKELNPAELAFALKCYGNKNLTLNDLKKLRKIFYKRNIYEIINRHIKKESVKAKTNILKLNLKNEYKEQIISLIKYLVNRIK